MFEREMEEEETPNKTATEWCLEQRDAFSSFVEECGQRLVLFNNWARDEQEKQRQVDELVRVIKSLGNEKSPYSNENFVRMERERRKLIIESKLPQMQEEIIRGTRLLSENLSKIDFKEPGAVKELANVRAKAHRLNEEICRNDENTGVLMPLKDSVESVLTSVAAVENTLRQHAEATAKRLKEERERAEQEKRNYERQVAENRAKQLELQEAEERRKRLEAEVENIKDEQRRREEEMRHKEAKREAKRQKEELMRERERYEKLQEEILKQKEKDRKKQDDLTKSMFDKMNQVVGTATSNLNKNSETLNNQAEKSEFFDKLVDGAANLAKSAVSKITSWFKW